MPQTASASGYSGKTNSPFNTPQVMELVSLKAEVTSLVPLIATAPYMDSPEYKGQTIFLMDEPDGIAWKNYEANQGLIPDQVTPTGGCMEITESNYAAIKIDNSEKKILGDKFDSYYGKVIDKTAEKLAPMYNSFVLGKQILAATPNMRGNRAGKYGQLNLGSLGNPLIINGKNIVGFFSQLNTLFDQYGLTSERKFMSAPTEINTVLLNSPFASYAQVGEKYGLMDGDYKTPANIMGFDIVTNNTVEPTYDPSTHEVIYYIVIGCKDATAFGGSVIEADEAKLVDGFGSLFKFQEVHGGAVAHPDAIAVAVVKFDFTA